MQVISTLALPTASAYLLSCRLEMRYKQAVTTSDNFLGMSGKDPSSSCCEELLVVLQLPRANSAAGAHEDWCSTPYGSREPFPCQRAVVLILACRTVLYCETHQVAWCVMTTAVDNQLASQPMSQRAAYQQPAACSASQNQCRSLAPN
jgi:hypothetical protein